MLSFSVIEKVVCGCVCVYIIILISAGKSVGDSVAGIVISESIPGSAFLCLLYFSNNLVEMSSVKKKDATVFSTQVVLHSVHLSSRSTLVVQNIPFLFNIPIKPVILLEKSTAEKDNLYRRVM